MFGRKATISVPDFVKPDGDGGYVTPDGRFVVRPALTVGVVGDGLGTKEVWKVMDLDGEAVLSADGDPYTARRADLSNAFGLVASVLRREGSL